MMTITILLQYLWYYGITRYYFERKDLPNDWALGLQIFKTLPILISETSLLYPFCLYAYLHTYNQIPGIMPRRILLRFRLGEISKWWIYSKFSTMIFLIHIAIKTTPAGRYRFHIDPMRCLHRIELISIPVVLLSWKYFYLKIHADSDKLDDRSSSVSELQTMAHL